MMNWILAFAGLAIIFLSKYASRSTKTEPSFKFWWNDNWVELVQGLLLTFCLMVILNLTTFDNTGFTIWLSEKFVKLPEGTELPAKEVVSLALGWLATWAVYWLNKRKAKWTLKNK